MLSMLFIIGLTSSVLKAKSTLENSRFKPEYFTRKRKMPFEKLLKFMFSMYRTSSQNALNKFFENEDITMSQQALSKARNKFDHSPFQKIYNAVRDAAYSSEQLSSLEKYDGKLIIAIDGSATELPNLPSLLEKFGGTGAKASSPTARMSIAYDVLNDLIVDADFSVVSQIN